MFAAWLAVGCAIAAVGRTAAARYGIFDARAHPAVAHSKAVNASCAAAGTDLSKAAVGCIIIAVGFAIFAVIWRAAVTRLLAGCRIFILLSSYSLVLIFAIVNIALRQCLRGGWLWDRRTTAARFASHFPHSMFWLFMFVVFVECCLYEEKLYFSDEYRLNFLD
jgi:hypothetical protein